ncbi:hypothetical protein BST81_08715 [Leptolyngbya sp. 'hensonii']|nr:hypothetical protein BST81_08715 [Leptolyngbya sp. 'hensonii']
MIVRLRLLWVILLALLCLSGCVRYDTGITFHSPTSGELVQQVHLDEQLTTLNQKAVQQWLGNLEQQARQLQGITRRQQNGDLTLTIPFFNGADLERKFNRFLDTAIRNDFLASNLSTTEPLKAQLKLAQSNFLLVQRHHLIYDIDLRPLASLATNSLTDSDRPLLKLDFSLNTPWGARSLAQTLAPIGRSSGPQLIWTLKPGQENRLEAVFWLPDPLGIGTLIIVLMVAGGIYVKSRLQPLPQTN